MLTIFQYLVQFGGQEPGTNEEIKKFAADRKFVGLLMDKVDVNGETASPVFKYLKVLLYTASEQAKEHNASTFSCYIITSITYPRMLLHNQFMNVLRFQPVGIYKLCNMSPSVNTVRSFSRARVTT